MTETLTNATGERIAGPTQPAELLPVRAVAEMIGASPRHVYRLSDAGRMPAPIKLGALVRWPRRVVLDWIAAGCPAVRTVGRTGR
ncbi:MAG: helix-turn-helix domain-containing protein [Phycisphaerales bacterium]|nr:helix-turn-helix domain-containing protein [Phycisphaerales bacterium]